MHIKHIYLAALCAGVLIAAAIVFSASAVSAKDVAAEKAIRQVVNDEMGKLAAHIQTTDQQAAAEKAAVDKQLAAAIKPADVARLIAQLAGLQRPVTIVPRLENRPPSESSPRQASAPGLEQTDNGKPETGNVWPSAPTPQPGDLLTPAADVPTLLQKLADGKKCGADLTACQSDLQDTDQQKQLLAQRAEAAEKAMKGGGFWARVQRNARWFALGGAAGAGAILATKH